MPLHGFNPKASSTITAIVFPIVLMIVAGILGKAWLVWLAVAYVVVMLCMMARMKFRQADQQAQYARYVSGQCVYCGYDLQGNQSGICPECGKGVPPAPAKPDQLW